MKFYVVIDSDGENGGVYEDKAKAMAAARSNNAQKYDSPQGGEGGFEVKTVEAEKGTSKAKVFAMVKGKTKSESAAINRFLGKDSIEEYTQESINGMSNDRLQEIYNTYYSGNMNDFRSSFKTINEVAQFLTYIIEMGTDTREIQQMVRVLE